MRVIVFPRRSGTGVKRKLDPETGADAKRAVDADDATEKGAELVARRQAEAGAAVLAVAHVFHRVEDLEEVREARGLDAAAVVVDFDDEPVALLGRGAADENLNLAAAGKAAGIIEKLAEDAVNQAPVD